MIELKRGAILLSDAHDSTHRERFYNFLKEIEQKDIKPPQLIFFGDMFEFLAGGLKFSEKLFAKHIKLINRLSLEIEIIYLEGNHDFNLQKLFPNVKVYPLQKQPLLTTFEDKKLLLSHGDDFENIGYKLFHTILRYPITIKFFDIFFGEKIVSNYLKKRVSKKLCKKSEKFNKYIKQKLKKFDIGLSDVDFIIQGHYHQGVRLDDIKPIYINLHSFGCDGKYLFLEDVINS